MANKSDGPAIANPNIRATLEALLITGGYLLASVASVMVLMPFIHDRTTASFWGMIILNVGIITLFLAARKRIERFAGMDMSHRETWPFTWLVWGLLPATWFGGQIALLLWVRQHGVDAGMSASQQVLHSAPVIATLFAGIILAPVAEEIAVRYVVFGRMRQQTGFIASAAISSLIFAILHGSAVRVAYTFLLGVLLATAYEVFRTLWVPIVMHVLFNIASALVPVKALLPMATTPWVVVIVSLVVMVLAGVMVGLDHPAEPSVEV